MNEKRTWLKDIRTKQGLTQEDIAEEVYISRAHYVYIEKGTSDPIVEVAKAIGDFLGFNWTRFYSVNEEVTSMTLNELQEIIHKNAVAHGWWENPRELPETLSLIHSEVSEVLEEYRNNKGVNEIYFSENGKPEGIPVELADIIIRVLDVAEYYKINMEDVILQKHQYNITRPYKHGKKV